MDLGERHTRTKSRDARFLARVFTPHERAAIEKSADPDTILWALWAGKEASYKAACKLQPQQRLSSAPARYEVDISDVAGFLMTGMVMSPLGQFSLNITVTAMYVHAVASRTSPPSAAVIKSAVSTMLPDGCCDESAQVRKDLCRDLGAFLSVNPQELEFIRPGPPNRLGPPEVRWLGHPLDIDITMSHHGRFIAYAFAPMRKRRQISLAKSHSIYDCLVENRSI